MHIFKTFKCNYSQYVITAVHSVPSVTLKHSCASVMRGSVTAVLLLESLLSVRPFLLKEYNLISCSSNTFLKILFSGFNACLLNSAVLVF